MIILSDALFLASALVDECARHGLDVDRARVDIYGAVDGSGERALISLQSPRDGQAVAARLRLPLSEIFYHEGHRMRSARWRVGRWSIETTWPMGGATR